MDFNNMTPCDSRIYCIHKSITMKARNFFDLEVFEDLKNRIHALDDTSQRLWGKMDVAQMLHHCQFPMQIALASESAPLKKNVVARWLFSKSLYSDKPFMKNLPTAPILRIKGPKDFEVEKVALLDLMEQLWKDRNNEDRRPHPVFKISTKEQWGKTQWKHLNHHLEQFGV